MSTVYLHEMRAAMYAKPGLVWIFQKCDTSPRVRGGGGEHSSLQVARLENAFGSRIRVAPQAIDESVESCRGVPTQIRFVIRYLPFAIRAAVAAVTRRAYFLSRVSAS